VTVAALVVSIVALAGSGSAVFIVWPLRRRRGRVETTLDEMPPEG
jgi:hypothetical protein